MEKKERKYRINVKTKFVLLVVLICLIVSIAGIRHAEAAVNRTRYLLGTDVADSQIQCWRLIRSMAFDPFNPNASTSSLYGSWASTTSPTSTSTSFTSRPPIRVPYRPALRSPYRPPL